MGADDGARRGDHHVEAVCVGFEAFMFGEMLGVTVGQMALEGVEWHLFVAGTVRLEAGGAQRSRDDQLVDAVALGGLDNMDSAANIGVEFSCLWAALPSIVETRAAQW